MNPAQRVSSAELTGRVNVFLSTLIWTVAGAFVFALNGDKINDGAFLREVFVLTYITCILVQVSVTCLAVLIVRHVKNRLGLDS